MRYQFPAEEKIRIVFQGLCGEDSVAELCRKEGINQPLAPPDALKALMFDMPTDI